MRFVHLAGFLEKGGGERGKSLDSLHKRW